MFKGSDISEEDNSKLFRKIISKSCRVSITRQQLFHVCNNDRQRSCISKVVENSHRYYGTVIGGNSASGYDVHWDVLPFHDSKTRVKWQ